MSEATPAASGPVILGRPLGPRAVDVAIALTLAVIGSLEVLRQLLPLPGDASPTELSIRLAPLWMIQLSTLSLALRRYLPMSVLVLVTTALVSSHYIDDTAAGWLSMMIAGFSAGIQGPARRAVIIGFAALTTIVLVVWLTAFGRLEFDPVMPGLVVVAAAFFWAGSVLRTRTRQAADLRAHTVRLELEREREAERAAVAERARIARELHDVIAHSLSVMVIQAAAARRVMDHDPARANEALHAVEETGRTAMGEMRRLLGVVRREEGEAAAPRAPQPSMASLERLIADMRHAGLDVSLSIEGEQSAVPPGVDVSAYRIVQEALTNALRHAPGASTRVAVRYRPREIELEIADDGGDAPLHPVPQSDARDQATAGGHGLAGMRERVALLHGQLEVGPRPEGGFRVFARLPLRAS